MLEFFCHLSDPEKQDLALFQDVFFFCNVTESPVFFMYAIQALTQTFQIYSLKVKQLTVMLDW